MDDISELPETEEDITVTIRDDTVIAKIQDLIAKHKLDPRIAGALFQTVFSACWPFKLPIDPKTLLFDEKLVDSTLAQIDVSRCPKAPIEAKVGDSKLPQETESETSKGPEFA